MRELQTSESMAVAGGDDLPDDGVFVHVSVREDKHGGYLIKAIAIVDMGPVYVESDVRLHI